MKLALVVSSACARQLEELRKANLACNDSAILVLPYRKHAEMYETMRAGAAEVTGHLFAATAGFGTAWIRAFTGSLPAWPVSNQPK